jgi:anti-anti-sigma regulatory factor
MPVPDHHRARLTVLVADGIIELVVAGELDTAQGRQFRIELLDACQLCVGTVIVNLRACTVLGATALRAVRDGQRATLGSSRCGLRVVCDDERFEPALREAGVATREVAGVRG